MPRPVLSVIDEQRNEGVRLIPRQQIVKGYEVDPNRYVQVTSEEFKALRVVANQHTEIQGSSLWQTSIRCILKRPISWDWKRGVRKLTRLLARAMRLQNGARLPSLSCVGKRSWCSYDRLRKTDYCLRCCTTRMRCGRPTKLPLETWP